MNLASQTKKNDGLSFINVADWRSKSQSLDCYFVLKGHKDCYCLYDAEPGTKTLMSFPVERKSTDTQSKVIPQSDSEV